MRAEEIIAQIYKHKKELESKGKKADRIVLTKAQYDTIQEYHLSLGELPAGMDYLDKYEIFGIPIYIKD